MYICHIQCVYRPPHDLRQVHEARGADLTAREVQEPQVRAAHPELRDLLGSRVADLRMRQHQRGRLLLAINSPAKRRDLELFEGPIKGS